MNFKPTIFILILAVILLTFYFFQHSQPIKSNYNTPIKIGNRTVYVEIADTQAKQTLGLSFRDKLEDGQGMLFTYNFPTNGSFWMKDMKFPIDIIFIKDKSVIKIFDNVQPQPNLKLDQLTLYNPDQNYDMVLEVPAGWSEKNQININSLLNYE